VGKRWDVVTNKKMAKKQKDLKEIVSINWYKFIGGLAGLIIGIIIIGSWILKIKNG